jgi:hypothetical protein
MISGHAGSLTTVHATTAHDAAIRLETLSMMSDVALPVHVARMQVASAIQLVVQISRFLDGSRKIRAITECLGLDEKGNYRFQDLYRFEARGIDDNGRIMGELQPTGVVPTFADEAAQMGYQDRVNLTRKLFTASWVGRVDGDPPSTILRLVGLAELDPPYGRSRRRFFCAVCNTCPVGRMRGCSQDKPTCSKKPPLLLGDTKMTTNLTNLFAKFHNDEAGLESLQVVMIIAIAAMIMVAAATIGNSGVKWMKDQAGKLVGKDLSAFGG